MKCLIYGAHEYSSWVKRFFPGVSPFFLKICNKPLLEYLIDFSVSLGISDIRLVISDASNDLENYFGDGTQWGVHLSFNVSRPDEDIHRILRKNSGFCKEEELLVINGFAFAHFGQDAKSDTLLKCSNGIVISNTGTSALHHFAVDASWQDTPLEVQNTDFTLTELSSVSVYYQLCMDLLKNPGTNILPGYASEPGVHLGKNIVYPRQTVLEKPFLLGDNVQLKSGVTIGPQSVIGNHNIIDSYTTVTRSIIYEKSYISNDLEIDGKIIFKNRLIDPHSGVSLDVTDNLFISGITHNISFYWLKSILRFFATFLITMVGIVPYLLALPLALLGGLSWEKSVCYTDVSGKEASFGWWRRDKANGLGKFLCRFSFDRFPLLLQVLSGTLHLVGNHLLPKTAQNLCLLQELPHYQPAVFDYASFMGTDCNDWDFMNHELYFISHDSFGFELRLLVQFAIKRLAGSI